MAKRNKVAVCDPDAFYPFRRLVEGPLTDPKDLDAAERFIRTAVLHDDLIMGIEPIQYKPEDYDAQRRVISETVTLAAAAGRPIPPGAPAGLIIVFTEKGVQEDRSGYGLFGGNLQGRLAPAVELSRSQLDIVSSYSNDQEGQPFYTSHLNYLRHLLGIVKEGGSILCDHPFPRAAIDRATQFPAQLFEPLDDDWKEYAQKIQSGRLGLVIPPLLSIVLNSCARRDAIPAVVNDIRRDWANAREKIWQLVEDQENARTVKEFNDIQQEFDAASKSFSPKNEAEGSSPLRMLWDIFAAATGGAVTAKLAGGSAPIGAVTKALTQLIGSAADAPDLFASGAFDLAGRVRNAAGAVDPMPNILSRFLSDSERRALGYTSTS
jgi:antitoxin component of RelBE/YafQ-DinJ toxin-antitoxin module